MLIFSVDWLKIRCLRLCDLSPSVTTTLTTKQGNINKRLKNYEKGLVLTLQPKI